MYCSSTKTNFSSVYSSHSMNISFCIPKQNFTWTLIGRYDIYPLLSLESCVANQEPAPLLALLLDSIIALKLSLVTPLSHVDSTFLKTTSLTLFYKTQDWTLLGNISLCRGSTLFLTCLGWWIFSSKRLQSAFLKPHVLSNQAEQPLTW